MRMSCVVVIGFGWVTAGSLGIPAVRAADGDVLLQYHSTSGVIPSELGWGYDVECLRNDCPEADESTPQCVNGFCQGGSDDGDACFISADCDPDRMCVYQGRDKAGTIINDCDYRVGCHDAATPQEHFHIPETQAVPYSCTYTEWIVFDDGIDQIHSGDPPGRRLTFPQCVDLGTTCFPGFSTEACSWGDHATPAFGAPLFAAPALGLPNGLGRPALRLSNGNGAGTFGYNPSTNESCCPNPQCGGAEPGCTPILRGTSDGVTHHNEGSTQMKKTFTLNDAEADAVTLLVHMAAGNRHPDNPMVTMHALGYVVSIGVDGTYDYNYDPLADQLRPFTYGGKDNSSTGTLFPGETVGVAMAKRGTWGPHAGEFFMIRLTLRSDGTFTAYLNENPAIVHQGAAPEASTTTRVILHRDTRNQDTMWLDFLQVFEGELPPGEINPCYAAADPVFDVRDDLGGAGPDGQVNAHDFDAFVACATGPTPNADLFDPQHASYIQDECYCMDVNGDKAVDQRDFAVFQRCRELLGGPLAACDD